MIYFGAVIITLAVIAFVAYPLIRHREEERERAPDEKKAELQSKKEAVFSAIKELHSDYELGNLSPQDHQSLEEKYKQKAAVILKELDSVDSGVREEDEIEKEILRLRRKREVGELACPRCGGKNAPSAKFCVHCGSGLSGRCPQCGASYNSGDRFCARCGASLVSPRKNQDESK